MIITFQLGQKLAKADLTKPIDISLETKEKTGFKAWYSTAVKSRWLGVRILLAVLKKEAL